MREFSRYSVRSAVRPVDAGAAGPKVLYITNQLPFPPHSGGQVREAEILSALGAQTQISLAVITEQFARDLAAAPLALAYCSEVAIFATAPHGEDGLPARVSAYRNDAFGDYLESTATRCDVINVEGYFLMRHLPPEIDTPIVLVAENVEYEIERQRERCYPNARSNPALVLELERAAWKKANTVAALTQDDLDTIHALSPTAEVMLSPNGFDHLRAREARVHQGRGSAVTFVGNYQWEPTRLGAERLVDIIWPQIHACAPDAILSLVGAGMSPGLRERAERTAGVVVVGEVNSVSPYLDKTDVFVCPVEMGSGIMMKLVEAMWAACPVVASPESLRGLPANVSSAVLSAKSNDDFAAGVLRLLDDPDLRMRLGEAAGAVCSKLPTWRDAAEILYGLWQSASAAMDRSR